MANPSGSEAAGATSCCRAKSKLTCLCSPTNHPGSFRCSRHRTARHAPRPLIPSSSSTLRARASHQHQQAVTPGAAGTRSGCGGVAGRTTSSSSKGRHVHVLRAHVHRLLASPLASSSGGRDHRRCREFKPRLSRLGRLAAVSS